MEQTVATFYQFAHLPDCLDWQKKLRTQCKKLNVLGTIILAEEGINATLSSNAKGIAEIMAFIKKDDRFANMPFRTSVTPRQTFYRIRVAVRKEIVTLGDSSVNPNEQVGTYVEPNQWNEIIQNPDVVVIDTRNDYEVEIGTFSDAINPGTNSFRELPKWIKKNKAMFRRKKVAMFCTGGIRCEKSTAFMKELGFKDVFHLEGGILKYLETTQKGKSLWRGECFVFDQRVSVGHGLKVGPYDLCHACRNAISEEDKLSPYYRLGISCPKCFGKISEERRGRFAERQKQIELAEKRKDKHLGARKLSKSTHSIKK